jgi:hypothetical protein
MNQKINTGLGVVIITIIAITAGVFVWKSYKINPILYQSTNLISVVKKPTRQTQTSQPVTINPQTIETQPTSTESIDGKCANGRFTNLAGGYSIECFPEWKYAIARTNEPRTGSLFGPDATETSADGGVEVEGFLSYDDYLKVYNDEWAKIRHITVNGINGIRGYYLGMGHGERARFCDKEVNKCFTIYIMEANNIKLFDRIINSFRIIK